MTFNRKAKPTPANYRRRIDTALNALEDAWRIAEERGETDKAKAAKNAYLWAVGAR